MKSFITFKVDAPKKKRPGVHAKRGQSAMPASKKYKKKYRGQGRP